MGRLEGVSQAKRASGLEVVFQLWLWIGYHQRGQTSATSLEPLNLVALGSCTLRQQAGPGETPGLYETFPVLDLWVSSSFWVPDIICILQQFLIHMSNCSLGS